MTSLDIARYRLVNQRIVATGFAAADALVGWMGCLRVQDFSQARWAIGNRVHNVAAAAIDHDLRTGKILRMHVLKPAWHFVLPADLGWMLQLTAPAIKALNKTLHRKLNIGDAMLKRSKLLIAKSLAGGERLTAAQLLNVLKEGRVDTDEIRFNFLLMDAELDALICCAGMQGKQFTYALLEEYMPGMKYPDRVNAIAALTLRYFASRGPATIQDFCWWSGLDAMDARKGLEMNQPGLTHAVVNGQAYWFAAGMQLLPAPETAVQLLPAWDEYLLSYHDHSDVQGFRSLQDAAFKPLLIMNGQVAGTWAYTAYAGRMQVSLHPFTTLRKGDVHMIREAAAHYALFSGQIFAGITIT